MNELDRKPFAEAMLTLSETFNEPLSDVKVEAYFGALSDHDIASVLGACTLALRTCKFFPRPAELREFVEGRAEDAAEQAWAAVVGEIRRVGYIGTPNIDARTLRAVRELWGGWQRLCETLPSEGAELVGWVKQFKATYQSVGRVEERQLTMDTLAPNVRAFITRERRKIGDGSQAS